MCFPGRALIFDKPRQRKIKSEDKAAGNLMRSLLGVLLSSELPAFSCISSLGTHSPEWWSLWLLAEETAAVLYRARRASSMFVVSEMLISTWPNAAPSLSKLLGLLLLASLPCNSKIREQAIKSLDCFYGQLSHKAWQEKHGSCSYLIIYQKWC